MNKQNVVLIGYNWNSLLGLARALGRDDYEVDVVRTGVSCTNPLKRIGQTPEKYSKYIDKYCLGDPADEDSIVKLLLNSFAVKENKSVLIPVDDRSAEVIDKNMDLLRDYFFMPNVNDTQGAVVQMMDKSIQKQLAKAAGLSVSDGYSVSIEQGSFIIPENIRYPCYVKAEKPFPGRKRYMGKCNDELELTALLKKVASKRDCLMIVEDYLEIEKEYCVVGICNGKEVYIPDVIDELVLGHGEHAGVTCFGKVMDPVHFDGDFISRLRTFLGNINFHGLFTVDVFKSHDKLYFGELNLRIGGSGIAVIGAGVNLATMIVDILSGKTIESPNVVCKEITFASERPLVNDLVTKRISWKQLKKMLSVADFKFVFSSADKAPSVAFIFFVIREYFKNCITRVK